VVNLDAPLGQQFFNITVGQAEARYQRTATAMTSRGKRYPGGADDMDDLDTATRSVSTATAPPNATGRTE
jgi:hypothetical protein